MEKNRKTYLYNDVYKQTLDYFNGDDLATSVWISKYSLKETDNSGNTIYYEVTPTDMFHRLAGELHRAGLKYENPLTYEEIFELINDFKYIVPQGSPMAGIGNDNDITSLSNCFVVSYPEQDSYGTIARVDQEIMQISKRRGGVGTDLSGYRSSNSKVKNAAMTSTGPVEICANRFSNTIREVGQNGRRGALMLSMDIEHKDAESFIDAKMENGKVTGANISVKIGDRWLNSFLNSTTPNKENERLWEKIIYNAWKSAEPGVLFWDTVINESVPDCYSEFGFKTISTNPCFPKSEYLLTKDGYCKFGDLYNIGEKNNVITDNRVSYVGKTDVEEPQNWKINANEIGTSERVASNVFLTKKNAEILELQFKNGYKLRCTPDHHIATTNRGMIEAKDINTDDHILISSPNENGSILGKLPSTKEEAISLLIGLIIGDGTICKKRKRCHIDLWGDDRFRMRDIVTNLIDSLYFEFGEIKNRKNRTLSKYFISEKNNKIRITSAWLTNILSLYGFDYNNKFSIPEFIINNSRSNIGKYFLAAIFYCDGTLNGSKKSGFTVRLSQSNKELLNKVQLILHSNGIIASLYKRRESGVKMLPDGKGGSKEYKTKEQFELISVNGGIERYLNTIGFLGDTKKEKKYNNITTKWAEQHTDKIILKTQCENEDVFCIQEPITRSIIVNGITTRRCGEIPLSNKDSCRLMLLNLYNYVKNPFSETPSFDFKLLREHSRKIIKIMDNMIDLEIEKIESIIKKVETDPEDEDTKKIELDLWREIKRVGLLGRRSGIGVTAEADMLAAMGYKYGTVEATEFSVKVHKLISTNVYIGSCDMCQIDNRPTFGVFDWELEKNNPFINRLINGKDLDSIELHYKIKKGRRNIACLTIPPAGSTSLMTQTTSGIEPLFKAYYNRKRKIDKNSGLLADFIDSTGDWFQTYFVIHPKFSVWYGIKNNLSYVEATNILSKMQESELDKIFENSPYFGATSSDVDWVEKVKMQGMVQKYIDHSISATTNIPKETSKEVVRKIYEEAWRSGCKGMTIYREGSRDGVLTSKKTEPIVEKQQRHAEKRPKSLIGKVVRFNNGGEKWVSVVGLLNEKPYEIFTGLLDKLNIPSNIDEGNIIKTKIPKVITDENGKEVIKQVSRYDFQYKTKEGELVTVKGLSTTFREEFWNYAKLISGLLRHNMPIEYVVDVISTLNLGGDNINSWKNGVIRTLKKFIKDGVTTGEKCPECGGKLVRQSGCISCQDCGYSKC